ncbi:MAG TPA: TolC family protein [Sediminibacterium sp.]|nr:TolC family protein [Sediminibacterium sp.]
MATFFPGKYVSIIGACLLFWCMKADAQKHFSLQELIQRSADYLPVLKQKQAQVQAATAAVTDVRHSFLPNLRFGEQLNIGSDNSLAGTYFTFGITPSTSSGVRSGNLMDAATGNLAVLYGEYELYNFGLNQAKIGLANSLVNLTEADRQQELYQVQRQVARLYFTILKNQYRLQADAENIQRYEQIFSVIHALTASGLKAGADSSQALAELSGTRISYNQTKGSIANLKAQLSFFTGIATDQLVIDTLVSGNSITPPPLMQDFGMDTINHPLLKYYAAQRNFLQSNDLLIRKSYLPKIMLAGAAWARGSSIQYNDQYKSLVTGLGYQRFNYGLGVAFTYNLFNGLYKKDKLAVNRYQVEASEEAFQQQRVGLLAAETQADNILRTTEANLREIPVQLQAAKDTYAQKLAQYRAGIISLIDLTNASFVLYRSQTDFIETVTDWYLAQLDKAAATGNLLTFIQTIK